MRYLIITFLLFFGASVIWAQQGADSAMINLLIDEVVVIEPFPFKSEKQQEQYLQMEEDLHKVYPLVLIVKKEYEKVNRELPMYEGDEKDAFLKWYENETKKKYLHHLSDINSRQGRLFLKLITRELNVTPYDLIKEYRNGFRAGLWQIAAHLHFTNLKAEYNPKENPMMEHILLKIEPVYKQQ